MATATTSCRSRPPATVEPLRCCLRYATPGEQIMLISYAPFAARIGVARGRSGVRPCEQHATATRTPPSCRHQLRTGPRLLRTYRADRTMNYDAQHARRRRRRHRSGHAPTARRAGRRASCTCARCCRSASSMRSPRDQNCRKMSWAIRTRCGSLSGVGPFRYHASTTVTLLSCPSALNAFGNGTAEGPLGSR